jgi:hypothetical protein
MREQKNFVKTPFILTTTFEFLKPEWNDGKLINNNLPKRPRENDERHEYKKSWTGP